MAKTIDQVIQEQADLALIYAEDGAYASAARVLEKLAGTVKRHAAMAGIIDRMMERNRLEDSL